MDNVRSQKLVSLIQGLAAQCFTLHHDEWGIDDMVMVDDVFSSPDMKNVDIWVSFSPYDTKRSDKNFEVLKKHTHELHSFVFENLHTKRMPKLHLKLSNPHETFKMMDLFATLENQENDGRDSTTDSTSDSGSQ